jgi:hypothetical protein
MSEVGPQSFVRSHAVRRARPARPQQQQLVRHDSPCASLVPDPLPPAPFSPLPLAGTRSWLHGLSFVSSGSVDLDSALGGGFLLHSLAALEEAEGGQHAAFTRVFAAEAFHHRQQLITVSALPSASTFLSELPRAASARRRGAAQQPDASRGVEEELRIAWRYAAYGSEGDERQQQRPPRALQAAASSGSSPALSLSQSYHLRQRAPPAASLVTSLHRHLQVRRGQSYRLLYEELAAALTAVHQSAACVSRVLLLSLGDVEWEDASGGDEVSATNCSCCCEKPLSVCVMIAVSLTPAYSP